MSRIPVPFATAGRGRGVRAERFHRDACSSCHAAPHDPNASLARRPVPFPGSEADLDGWPTDVDEFDAPPFEGATSRRGTPAWPRGR